MLFEILMIRLYDITIISAVLNGCEIWCLTLTEEVTGNLAYYMMKKYVIYIGHLGRQNRLVMFLNCKREETCIKCRWVTVT
jgi:hypothetical protein